MAISLTRAEAIAQLRAAIKILDDELANASGVYLVNEDALVQLAEGDFADVLLNGLGSLRASKDAVLRAGTFLTDPILRDLAGTINSSATDPRAILRDFADDMISVGDTVESRGVTRTRPAAAGAQRATQTLTFFGPPSPTETVTINGAVYTFVAARAAAGQVTVGADAPTSATNLAAAILGDDAFGPIQSDVHAEVAGSVVTLIALEHGTKGNVFTLAEAAINVTAGGATFAGGADPTNDGDGVMLRLGIDEDGYGIDSIHADSYVADVTVDGNTGARRGNETLRLRGAEAGKDLLTVGGSGRSTLMSVASVDNGLLTNGSFSQFSGTVAAPDGITGWTTPSPTFVNFQLDETNFFRQALEEPQGRALKVLASDTIRQRLEASGATLAAGVPHLLALRFNRSVGAASGSLRVTVGNAVARCVLGTQVGWHLLALALNSRLWPVRMSAADLEVSIQATLTAGTLLVDEVILAPMLQHDRTWYLPVTGAAEHLLDDRFSWADTVANTGKIQRWMHRLYGVHLPHVAAGNTITDP